MGNNDMLVEILKIVNSVREEQKENKKELLDKFDEMKKDNDKRWEENNRRWEENDKRWEENDKNSIINLKSIPIKITNNI